MSVRSSMDVGRLAAAVQRPGIDPRVWITYAVVKDIAFDPEHGVFADVQVVPEGDIETCLVGSDYAGSGFGDYDPLHVGDLVLVAISHGDPGTGPVIIKRVFSASAKPPTEFKSTTGSDPTDATNDRVIVVEPNTTLRVIAKQGANVSFEVQDGGAVNITAKGDSTVNVKAEKAVVVDAPDVRLGDTPSQEVARRGDIIIGPGLVVGPGLAAGSPVLPVPSSAVNPPIVGQIVSGATSVKA